MNLEAVPPRYCRNLNTISAAEQKRLLHSRIAIVGLGGLGGFVAENLARIGVGHLTLIDNDRFDETNLNRQLLCTQETIGAIKVETAVKRVYAINSAIQATAYPEALSPENAFRLLAGHEVIVDCLDSIGARLLLSQTAQRLGIPLVSAAVAGMTGHVTTVFPHDQGLERIYGASPEGSSGAEQVLGCMAFTVMLLAALEVAEVMKVLLGRGVILRSRLLVVDLEDYTIETIDL